MCLNFQWLQMSLHSLFLLFMRILVLRILPSIPRYFHLLHARSCISIWKTLWTSLQVLILHSRHHSSWTGILLPFLLGYFFIAGRLYINDVAQQCHITRVSLRSLSFFESIVIFFFILDFFLNCRHLFFRTSLILIVRDLSYKSNAPVVWLETFHNGKFLCIKI